LLNCACFIYIGAWLPFESYNNSTLGIAPWKLVVLFIAILFLRRIPSLLLMYKFIPDIRNWREALFCGHFGPMGVGAIFISTLAITRLPVPQDPPANQKEILAASLQPIVSFIVLCSILIHGLSIPAFWFGRKMHSRTVSVSATWSRTINSRTGQDPPDWLLWARRPSAPIATSPTPLDIEQGDGVSPTAPTFVETPKGTLVGRRTRPSSLERLSKAEKLASSPTSSAPRTRSSTPVSAPASGSGHNSQEGKGGLRPSTVMAESPAAATGAGVESQENVRTSNQAEDIDDVEDNSMDEAGYGFASLHDKKENVGMPEEIDASGIGRELNGDTRESTSTPVITKQVQFVQ